MIAGTNRIITLLIVVFILATTAPAQQRQKVMRKVKLHKKSVMFCGFVALINSIARTIIETASNWLKKYSSVITNA
jgi:hypothetical protein